MSMGEEIIVHKVSQSGFRRKPCRKLKGPATRSSVIPTGLSPDQSNLDISTFGQLDHCPSPSSFIRRRSIKDRRSSSADSATIEKAVRILKTIRTLKEVARAELSAVVPSTNYSRRKLSSSDTWSCVLADSSTRRHLVQSLTCTSKNHEISNAVPIGESNVSSKVCTASGEASGDGTSTYYKAHDFQIYNCKCPKRCAVCQRLLWNLSQHAMECQVCGVVIHKQCYAAAMKQKCVPSKKMIQHAFGVDLTIAAMMDGDEIPKVVSECVQAIESKGLTDKSLYGVSGYMSDVMEIREKFNKGEDVDLSRYTDVKIITGVLKQFLRELPQPVISHDAYSQMMRATAAVSTMESSGDVDYTVLSNALKLLPKAHYLLLKYLGEHLYRVVDHSAENLMTAHNLAAIMSPTLMRAPDGNTTIFKDTHLQQYFVECVITKHEVLFS